MQVHPYRSEKLEDIEPLIKAIDNDDAETLEKLIDESGVDITEFVDKDETFTLLSKAVALKSEKCAKLLVNHDKLDLSLSQDFVKSKSWIDVLKFVHEMGKDLSEICPYLLINAHPDVIRAAFSIGFSDQTECLNYQDNVESYKLLVEAKADVNEQQALWKYCCLGDDAKVVSYLASLTSKDELQRKEYREDALGSVFRRALPHYNGDSMVPLNEDLVAKIPGIIAAFHHNGYVASAETLQRAVELPDCLALLLQQDGIDVNARAAEHGLLGSGQTALEFALLNGGPFYTESIALLKQHGAVE